MVETVPEYKYPITDGLKLLLPLGVTVVLGALAGIALASSNDLVEKVARLALYLAPLPFVLTLSRYFPAQLTRQHPAASMLQDIGYFALIVVLRIVYTVLFITWLSSWYERHMGFLTLELGVGWSVELRILLAFLISDFLGWFHHFVRHRITTFWEFHKVHHSQTELNYFTDFRMHPLDYVIASLIIIVPQLVVRVDAPTIILIGIIVQWHTMIYHCNLRTNYGLLRFVLVTPQSHRIHHSRETSHRGKNFGVVFSVWDHLFGTQYRNYNIYPTTGVEASFPVENSTANVLSLRPFIQQFVYPFARIWKRSL